MRKLKAVNRIMMFTAVFFAGMIPSGPRYLWYGPPSAFSSSLVSTRVWGVNQTRKAPTMTMARYLTYLL